jgi:hypothetical protein
LQPENTSPGKPKKVVNLKALDEEYALKAKELRWEEYKKRQGNPNFVQKNQEAQRFAFKD